MTAALTPGSFSSHSAIAPLNESLARPVAVHRALRRRVEIFADRLPAHVEMPLDLANGPVLGPVEPVQIVDLFDGQHG
jgi:hypothetical protein